MARIIRTDLCVPGDFAGNGGTQWEKDQVYNGLDCCITRECFDAMLPQLGPETSATYHLSRRLQGPLLEVGLRGVRIDQARKAEVIDEKLVSLNCPLLVPLIEEGLFDDEITRTMLRRYLDPLLRAGIDTLVLGCTHYPLLKSVMARLCGKRVTLVDSAENCALAVRALIAPSGNLSQEGTPRLDVLLTDSSEGFLRIAEKSLDLTIDSLGIRELGK